MTTEKTQKTQKTAAQKTAAQKTVHLTTEIGNPSYCNATSRTTEDNASEAIEDVTCKRCLTAHAKAVAAPVVPDTDEDDDFLPPPVKVIPASQLVPVVDLTPVGDSQTVGATDPKPTTLKDKAKAVATAAPKAKKPATTVHLVDHTNERTGTSCNIPASGPDAMTTDPSAVTCKVCLFKLAGAKPINTIPDEVKAARKAFRSFVARATYMAYMDSNQLGTGWTLTHTNMAGEYYQITATGHADGLYLCNDSIAGNTKASLIETIERLGWSCGEDK